MMFLAASQKFESADEQWAWTWWAVQSSLTTYWKKQIGRSICRDVVWHWESLCVCVRFWLPCMWAWGRYWMCVWVDTADVIMTFDLCLQSMAFCDVSPMSPVHILVIPRKPIPMLSQAGEDDTEVHGHLFSYPLQHNSLRVVWWSLGLFSFSPSQFTWPPGW